ncbi:MAG TPA: lipid II flippase MurJ [Chitinophagaceae bacterium]|jgi:putative peptidoglycan lipid II flippase|nr:lipid II flippase MurJ [Chitinophagaceae bacterium]
MLKTESYKKAVVYSTGLNIVAKGIQFLNILIIAYFFGTSISTDIFFLILSVSVLITTSMINSIDATILIPEAMKQRERNGEEASRQFLNFFGLLYVLVGSVILLFIVIFPALFYDGFSKFPSSTLREKQNLLYAGGVLIFFQLNNNFLGAVLSSYKYFSLTVFTGLLTSLFSILATVLFHKQLGIEGTLTAVAVSYFINFLFLLGVMKFKLKWQFTGVKIVKDKHIWGNIGLMQLNLLPVWLRNYVTIFLLSGLGIGVLSSVNLAQQAAAIIDTLIIAQVLAVAGIKFNELHARLDFVALNELFIRIANYLILFLVPIVVVTFFYSTEITSLIFKRGNMKSDSVENVALCLKYLILVSPLLLLNSICTRIFSSAQVIRQGLVYSLIAHFIFLALTIVFINWLQLRGFLYSMLIGYTVLILLFYRLFKIKLKQIEFDKVLLFLLKQAVINFAVALPVFLILWNFTDINYIITLCIGGFIQVIAIILLNKKYLQFSRIKDLLYGFRNK